MFYPVVIIGAGPGGLTCAKILAKAGIRCLVIEHKREIGPKVCAGGITMHGFMKKVPKELIEKSFRTQFIKTRFQDFSLTSSEPIIATINRKALGQYMAKQAGIAGAEFLTSHHVLSINENQLLVKSKQNGKTFAVSFDHVVGADGSASLVRRTCNLGKDRMAIGINYQIPGNVDKMEWHYEPRYFQNGYGWIFPHKETISIGAYGDRDVISSSELKNNLLIWASTLGYDLHNHQPRAELINFNYKGYRFGNKFLIGDAAGLASPLTGEGIHPAILSAEIVAKSIINPDHEETTINKLAAKHRFYYNVFLKSGRSPFVHLLASELGSFGLRLGLIKIYHLEMAVYQ